MINLVNGLPNTISVNGKPFLIKTDYRVWLEFGKLYENLENALYSDFAFVFENKVPNTEFLAPLADFYVSASSTPKATNTTKVIDYLNDGEYIYASVLEQYGIDLVDVKHLHWHKFLAMMRGISGIMGQIMAYRGYEKQSGDFDEHMKKQKEIWQLPILETQSQLLNEINNEFYNS